METGEGHERSDSLERRTREAAVRRGADRPGDREARQEEQADRGDAPPPDAARASQDPSPERRWAPRRRGSRPPEAHSPQAPPSPRLGQGRCRGPQHRTDRPRRARRGGASDPRRGEARPRRRAARARGTHLPRAPESPRPMSKPIYIVFEGVDGAGKCFGAGTEVLLHDGSTRKIEDIQQGTLLMGPDSKPRTVVDTIRGKEPMFRVVPVKGDSFVVNSSHLLSLKRAGTRSVYPSRFDKPGGNGVMTISVSDFMKQSPCL